MTSLFLWAFKPTVILYYRAKKQLILIYYLELAYIAIESDCVFCLPCFDTVDWVSGRASGLKKIECCSAGMVICLKQSANDLHMVQLMPAHRLLLH